MHFLDFLREQTDYGFRPPSGMDVLLKENHDGTRSFVCHATPRVCARMAARLHKRGITTITLKNAYPKALKCENFKAP